MSIQHSYTTWSLSYDLDHNRTRDLDQEITSLMLAGKRYQSILEIGCGTGKNTAILAQIGEQVRAFDFSEGMIAKAREKLKACNVTYTLTDLTKPWPCEDQWAELVVCNLVLEHIEDLAFIFSEAHRTLKAGGCFFVSELHPFRQYQGTKANFHQGEGHTEIQAFTHHISDFFQAAQKNGFALEDFTESWHEEDQGRPPRLAIFIFRK
jgi:malonyl-CoA O-methyltransferase